MPLIVLRIAANPVVRTIARCPLGRASARGNPIVGAGGLRKQSHSLGTGRTGILG